MATEDIQKTLAERGGRYGVFNEHARITQLQKEFFRSLPNWEKLSMSQREALDMIAHKIGRIMNGDPNYPDSWHDLAGYSQLVVNELEASK